MYITGILLVCKVLQVTSRKQYFIYVTFFVECRELGCEWPKMKLEI